MMTSEGPFSSEPEGTFDGHPRVRFVSNFEFPKKKPKKGTTNPATLRPDHASGGAGRD